LPPCRNPSLMRECEIAAGRLRLATRPTLTGSSPVVKTIGIVAVVALAARADIVPPVAANTATPPFQLIELHSNPCQPGSDCKDIELAKISQEVTERFCKLLAVARPRRLNCRQSLLRLRCGIVTLLAGFVVNPWGHNRGLTVASEIHHS
jgi:hypothetical protein